MTPCPQHLAITFAQGVSVGKSVLSSVMVCSVKGDTLCDFECGPSDVARAQVKKWIVNCDSILQKWIVYCISVNVMLRNRASMLTPTCERLCGSDCSSAAVAAA